MPSQRSIPFSKISAEDSHFGAMSSLRRSHPSLWYNTRMEKTDSSNAFPLVLAICLTATIGWSAWHPAEWGVWWMEMVWVLGAFGLLAATYRRFHFSNLAYGIVFIWLMLHTFGAHYTFEHVPAAWLQDLLGSERNHYDRVAHFCVGLNSFMLAELALRKRWAPSSQPHSFSGRTSPGPDVGRRPNLPEDTRRTPRVLFAQAVLSRRRTHRSKVRMILVQAASY